VLANRNIRFYNSTNIAEEFRSTSGTVIIFSVWHREPVLFNAFLGEVVIPLRDLRELTAIQTVDDLPAVMMQLRHPKEPRDGPYKVCKSLSEKTLNMLEYTEKLAVAYFQKFSNCDCQSAIELFDTCIYFLLVTTIPVARRLSLLMLFLLT